MKKHLLRISVFAVIAAAAAHAQNFTRVQANVPFDFVVDGQTLQAGQYTVGQGKVGGVVVIEATDRKGHSAAIGVPMPRIPTKRNTPSICKTRSRSSPVGGSFTNT